MFGRVLHITLAFVLLLSSTGLVLNKHYCQDELKSVALFSKAKPCHKSSMPKSCPMHGGTSSDQDDSKGCCDDQSEFLKSDQDQLFHSLDYDQNQGPDFLATPVAFHGFPTDDLAQVDPHYFNYKPPLILYHRSAFLQIWLC